MSTRDIRVVTGLHFIVAAFMLLTLLGGCGGFIPSGGAGGPFPIDSAHAVAVAQRNLCGSALPPTDTTCVVEAYRRVRSRYIITLRRRPPAGNDRVVVTLLDNGTRVQAEEADSLRRKP